LKKRVIAAMTTQIVKATTDKAEKVAEIRELEKQTTSIQPTIADITG